MPRLTVCALIFSFLTGGALASPEFWKSEWPKTDFEITSVDNWVEILSGGPPKDGIPAIDAPTFQKAAIDKQERSPTG